MIFKAKFLKVLFYGLSAIIILYILNDLWFQVGLKKCNWSIGIYSGRSPLQLEAPEVLKNPVLSAKDVRDVQAAFVADPFMVYHQSTWFMYFEVFNEHTEQGDIGLATSENGLDWQYQSVVIDEAFHLSYPYVFKWKNEFYMIPESYQTNAIQLYKAVNFPESWRIVSEIVVGSAFVDPSIVYFNNKWWLFTSVRNEENLYLFYSNSLDGIWKPHPYNPIVENDINRARPGGRIIFWDDKLIRFAQDGYPDYGSKVRAFEIFELTTEVYREKETSENPILSASSEGWNKDGMHNIDPHQIGVNQWIGCVDGREETWIFKKTY